MEDERLVERVLSKQEVFHGKLIRVEHWQAGLSNGREALREIVKHPGAAAIVPVDEDGMVTLVKQYRIAMGRGMLEIPAGKKDSPEEDALACAVRELSEETGFSARYWRYLTTLDTSPGFLTERIGLFLATGLEKGKAHPDEDEFLNVVHMPLEDAVARVLRGEICDAKTVCGLLMAWNILSKDKGECT